jgi:transposase
VIQVTPQMRVLLATEPADFRNGMDGLARLCREALAEEPFSGVVFGFRNRRATAVKLLVYDGRGFWLCHMRLSEGRLGWWPRAGAEGAKGHELASYELSVLLAGGDPRGARGQPAWRRVQAPPPPAKARPEAVAPPT